MSLGMADKIQCSTHGERFEAFVCSHLASRDSVALGFNRNEPSNEDPFPDAWCDDCEIIRVASNGWNKESEKLADIKYICSGCYEIIRIRNTRTQITLNDLASLRWKCGHCEEWHTGVPLDFGYDWPDYWTKEHDQQNRRNRLRPSLHKKSPETFLDDDYCAIGDEYFFQRGLIRLPIVGTREHFNWGVWGSLSRKNFETVLHMQNNKRRVDLPPMFSWLSNSISEYPETLSLKMYAHIQEPGTRPHFELEETDHPLSQEYHHGVSSERIREIISRRLKLETKL